MKNYWRIEIWLCTSNLSSCKQADFKLLSLIPLMTQTLSLWCYGNKWRLFSSCLLAANASHSAKAKKSLQLFAQTPRPRNRCFPLDRHITVFKTARWAHVNASYYTLTHMQVYALSHKQACSGYCAVRHSWRAETPWQLLWQKTLRRRRRWRTLFVLLHACARVH